MNVSSVPYSLSDIQLPDSPTTNVKPQTKSGSVHAQSDEEQTPNNSTNSNISKKAKKLEDGDMNGKASKPEIRSEDMKQGSDNEKTHRSKVPGVDNFKENRGDFSSGDEKTKDKGRRKNRDSSDDSRSPVKKSSESSRSRRRRNRSSSAEDRGHSRSKSPKGSKSSRRGRRRSPSSEKEHKSKSKHKKSGSRKEKSKKRDKRSPSSDRSPSPHKDRSPRKPYKVRRKGGHVSSEEEQHSKTRKGESPQKDAKVGGRKDRSVSSGDERNSRTRSRESPKKDAKSVRKDTSVSSGDERQSRTRSKGSPKRVTELSRREKSISPVRDFKNKDSDAMEVEQISPKEKSSLEENPKKEETRTSEEKQIPKKTTLSDSETSSPESSPQKISHTMEKSTIKEQKRKLSVSSDEDSKRTESPIKKPKPSTLPEPIDSPEKMDCESFQNDEPRRSRRDSSPNSKRQAKRTDSSRSRSPEKADENRFSIRPPSPQAKRIDSSRISSPDKAKFSKRPLSPKEAHSRESSSEKVDAKDPQKGFKDEVSDGELPSSREISPARKAVERKPSHDSAVSRSGTMIVIRKEAPKQKLKIKRDNVVVVKREEKEDAAEENKSANETAVVETPEPIEKLILEPGECPDVPPNTNYVRRKIVLSSRKQAEKPNEEPATKKSKWGSFAASRKAKQTVSISTDSLKNWFPDFKILKEPAPETIPEDLLSPVNQERDVEMTPIDKVTEPSEPKMIAITRRLEPLPAEAALKPPTEPINDDEQGVEPTPILFVQNLVRPFTLLQLKELLGETGKMVDDGFWIDKIKSKCIVTYETVEEAVKTRKILNGARWPMSNPKILAVSFATEEDLSSQRSGLADQPKPRPPSPPKEEPQPMRRMVVPMREWDKDKVSQDFPERQHRRDEDRTRDKREPKKRGVPEDTPAKLLDDLFQKTKATPCIYWLPLTQEQIKERDERRKQMNQERDRRNQEREQENKRPRSRQRETRRSSPSRSRSPVTRRR